MEYNPSTFHSGTIISIVSHMYMCFIGNYLDTTMKEETEIRRRKGDIVQRVDNMLVSTGLNSEAVVRKAYTTQCAHLYGAVAWIFRDKAVSEFQTTWNKCVRRIFNLPYTTHTRFLPHIREISTVTDQIYGCFLKIIKTMEQSNKMRVQYITKLSIS